MKALSLFIFCSLLVSSCVGQLHKVSGFNSYKVGNIDSLESFMRFTPFEKRTDSIYKIGDNIIDSVRKELEAGTINKNNDTAKVIRDIFAFEINNFISNRARIFINGTRNGKIEPGDPMAATGLPAPCKCFQDRDSISVEFAFGFFGGVAFRQKIIDSAFRTNISVITRDANIYKVKPSDRVFKSEIVLAPLKQSMILLNKPKMQLGEQLTGFVTVQSQPFFEEAGKNKVDTVSINVRYFFTCKTLKRPDISIFHFSD